MTDFTIPDPYEGWSEAELKLRCRKLVRASVSLELLVALIVDVVPGEILEQLPERERTRAISFHKTYFERD